MYAGGLIGHVIGGNVIIENCYFDGSINAESRIISLWRLGEQVVSVFSPAPPLLALLGLLPDEVVNQLFDVAQQNYSYAYAGGLIGSIEGTSQVIIQNSYTRGNVYAWASTTELLSSLIINNRSCAYAGGLVGYLRDSSQLSIYNSYSTANVIANTTANMFANPTQNFSATKYINAGGLLVRGTVSQDPEKFMATNYRLDNQIVRAGEGIITRSYNTGDINRFGTELSHAEMQNRYSFIGWVFGNDSWTIEPGKNDGYPYPQVFDNSFTPKPRFPFNAFINNFSRTLGSGMGITISIDHDFSLFEDVYVNDSLLTRDVHYEAFSGSVIISLLPEYLDSLDSGFHELRVTFVDGTILENEFLIVEADGTELLPPLDELYYMYLDDLLLFSMDGSGILVDDDFFELLADGAYTIRAVFLDGSIVEELFLAGDAEIPEEWYSRVEHQHDYGEDVLINNNRLTSDREVQMVVSFDFGSLRPVLAITLAAVLLTVFVVIIVIIARRNKKRN
jgi:hypothetical protein